MQKLLITNNQLYKIQGSELVTIEIVDHFIKKGWHVHIYTNEYGGAIEEELNKMSGKENIFVTTNARYNFNDDYDLIWIQQHALPIKIIERLATEGITTKIIYHHMSPFVHMEMPLLSNIENDIADIVTAVSSETQAVLYGLGILKSTTVLFENPAPEEFFSFPTNKNGNNALNNILIVSNHPPSEIKEARRLLKEKGIRCDILGESNKVTRITPSILADYDVVITIGKTVQYAMCMGIPCYVYDHFGGDGYIYESNLENMAYNNFSGRNSNRKISATSITKEIISGFSQAKFFASSLTDQEKFRWHLPSKLDSLLAQLRSYPKIKKTISPEDARKLALLSDITRHSYFLYRKLQATLQAEAPSLRQEHENIEVLFTNNDQDYLNVIKATPRENGYLTLNIPIGNFNSLILFGRHYSWIQIDSIKKLEPNNDSMSEKALLINQDLLSYDMEHKYGGIFSLSDQGALFIPESESNNHVCQIIFRPLENNRTE